MSFTENLRESAVFNFSDAVTMVVDDSDFGLELTTEALRGFGVQIRYLCANAGEAIKILKDHPIDLLFVGRDLRPTVEPGRFQVWIAPSAQAEGVSGAFTLA